MEYDGARQDAERFGDILGRLILLDQSGYLDFGGCQIEIRRGEFSGKRGDDSVNMIFQSERALLLGRRQLTGMTKK